MKITVEMVWKHNPCQPEWNKDRLKKVLGKGKTLLQILSLKVPAKDRIWCVTRFLPEETNRAFAIWCAKQCKTNCKEITAYIDTIEKYYQGKATKEELDAADSYLAAHSAAYSAADSAANSAAHWTAHWAAYWEANSAAYSAADLAAHSAAERRKQIKKLKEMIRKNIEPR